MALRIEMNEFHFAGSEHAHAQPKALYKQTNKQETGYSYMKSMLARQEVCQFCF